MGALWRRKIGITCAAVLGMLAGVIAGGVTTPVYRAQTSLQLERLNENYFLRDVNPVSPASPDNYLHNEVKLLQSETLAKRVADTLKLPIGQSSPPSKRLLLSLFARRQTEPNAAAAAERRIRSIQGALTVRTSMQSHVIDVFFDSENPKTAAKGANAIAAEFIDLNREARWQLVQDSTAWLSKQAVSLKSKLEKASRELQDYARSSGLVFAGSQNTLAEDRMRRIQEALTRAVEDRAAKQSRLEAAMSSPMSMLADNSAGPLRQYQTELQSLRRYLAELKTLYTPSYYRVQRVEAQIAQVEEAIAKEHTFILGRLRTEYVATAALERRLSSEYNQQLRTIQEQTRKTDYYNLLKREVESTQQLYESMLQRSKEAAAASASQATNIRIIDQARIPSTPYKPNTMLNLALGLAVGMFGGVCFAFAREQSDKVKHPGDSTFLAVPELGVIPSARDDSGLRLLRQSLMWLKPSTGNLELVTWNQDNSLLSESFRATLASILFSSDSRNLLFGCSGGLYGQALVVTSCGVSEGKTTVLTNLGIALAETRRRVLLIDADLRRPRLHNVFDKCNDCGLTNLLDTSKAQDNTAADTLVLRTDIPNLWLLPSGPGTEAISSLLYSATLDGVLRRLRRQFHLILIDTPPIKLFSDARVIGRMSDGVLLVIRANRATRDEVKASYLRLRQDRTPIIGTILNDWRMEVGHCRTYCEQYGRYQRRDR
jgi:capsular exopolysaccharide synthesis family protein